MVPKLTDAFCDGQLNKSDQGLASFASRSRVEEELFPLLGRFSPGTGEWERREIMALPAETRALVLRRVDVIDRYLALEKGSAAAADAAADALSMPRSNFYRLLARYRQVGAALGLVPHARIPKAGSPGGPYDFSSELARIVRDDPDAKLANIMDALSKSTAAIEGAQLPSRATIQRRVAALRSTTQAPPQALGRTKRRDARFGRDLLIDQCAFGVPAHDGPFGASLGIAFVLDLDTRLIIGVGLGPLGDGLRTLAAALYDSDEFWSSPLLGSIPASRMPERVEWVPPDNWQMATTALAADWNVTDATNASPKRRHGARLLDVIGNELARYPLLTFVGDGLDAEPSLPAEPLISLAGALSKAVDEWNVEIVRRNEGARLVLRGPTWDRRVAEWTSRIRASDLDGGELALLLTGAPLPADASRGAVRSIWRRRSG